MIEATVLCHALRLETAPTLFSPRRVDEGTLALLSRVGFASDDKVLDLGCGYGVVGVVAAKIVGAQRVWLLDNDPLAVATARQNLRLNDVEAAHCVVSDGFSHRAESGFTKILCNPPYHADFSVPRRLIEKGFNHLVIAGALWMVTRRTAWYRNKLRNVFGGAREHADGGYIVFEAIRTSASYAVKSR